MGKLIFSILACIMLSACMPKVAIKEKVVTKEIPIFVIPRPPEVSQKPVLATSKLTAEDKNKVSRAMEISIQQLISYSSDLEKVYNKYKELSNTSTPITNFDPKTPALLDIDKLKEFLDKYKFGSK